MSYPFGLAGENGGAPVSSRRRQHPGQPPSLLTTSLTNAQNLGLGLGLGPGGQTPVNPHSLSSPFSVYSPSPSPYSPSPGGGQVGSPMASRNAAAFSGQYNPQQWGRMTSNDSSPASAVNSPFLTVHTRQPSTRTTVFATRLIGPDEPVASPPPPYSPARPEDSLGGSSNLISPSDTVSPATDSSYGNTPTSAATTVSPGPGLSSTGRRSPISSNINHTSSPMLGQQPAFPPPPSSSGPRVRSASKNHADRILFAMSLRGRNSNAPPPVNAIDTLQRHTAQVLAVRREPPRIEPVRQPPASRRAASTGAIGLSTASARSPISSSPPTWSNRVQLPPPPPGPPPAPAPTSRSQSLCRPSGPSLPVVPDAGTERRLRQRPVHGTGLETIPPTPANWTEDGPTEQTTWPADSTWPRSLHIDTNSAVRDLTAQDNVVVPLATEHSSSSHVRSPSTSGMLLRSPAVRNRSAKGIRERRSESRTGKSRAVDDIPSPLTIASPVEASIETRPGDLILPLGSGDLHRRRQSTRLTPRSTKKYPGLDETLHSANATLSGRAIHFESSHTTPRPEDQLTPTPPFSPGTETFKDQLSGRPGSARPRSRALPTPPLQSSSDGQKVMSLGVSHPSDLRPMSSLLHTPNPEVPIDVMPLSPDSPHSLIDVNGPDSPKAFGQRAAHRYRMFAEREIACHTDSERLDVFCQFMVAESRIRRQQYASVFESEGLEIADLTEGMFKLPEKKTEQLPAQSGHGTRGGTTRRSSSTSFSESRSRGASTTATSEPVLIIDTSVGTANHGDSWQRNDYVPCLSPIASMSAVTGRDEDSRGRTPSRWWESQSGDSDGFRVMGRSKRESRYMAVPQEARYSPAKFDHAAPPAVSDPYHEMPSSSRQPAFQFGPDEYPPEKSGWPEEQPALPPPPPNPPTPMSAPYTPDPRKLDISRLITLPPPYPRHYPAVNNNHPDLAVVRAVVRSLNDLEEASATREKYQTRIHEKRLRADSWCKHQRSLHTQDVQYRMEHGELSQEQFDQAETDLEAKEAQSQKELTQAEFDLFQSDVVSPLHTIFAERITKATNSFDALTSRLSSDAQSHSPNLPQVEGDEQPELLEKLTQLKWLFEARENLHRETYNLLSERNEKYKAIVLLPYLQTRNHEKQADAESFFEKDAIDRRVAYEKAALARFEAFLKVIDQHVTRGVEIQISAFWDIAPSLLSLLQQIPRSPDRLRTFDVLIPRAEVDENPSYWDHPLRYLYTLLTHAESSTRQFIESQVSLWCLLQEVREGVSGCKWRVEENRAQSEGRDLGRAQVEERKREGARLVEDLKERVGVVEGQWGEALGAELGRCKGGVRGWLEGTGGWDEELEGGN